MFRVCKSETNEEIGRMYVKSHCFAVEKIYGKGMGRNRRKDKNEDVRRKRRINEESGLIAYSHLHAKIHKHEKKHERKSSRLLHRSKLWARYKPSRDLYRLSLQLAVTRKSWTNQKVTNVGYHMVAPRNAQRRGEFHEDTAGGCDSLCDVVEQPRPETSLREYNEI